LHPSPLSFGSEFKLSIELEELLQNHPWSYLKDILDNGARCPLHPNQNEDRDMDLDFHLERGIPNYIYIYIYIYIYVYISIMASLSPFQSRYFLIG